MALVDAPVFCGTRVPVQTLLDHLDASDTIDDFLAGFLTVARQHVIAFLEDAKDRVPDRCILCLAQADVLDVNRLVTGLLQPIRQRRRQLGIDQELHLAGDMTA
jgi:uncharacterized protein (DUF433 family)